MTETKTQWTAEELGRRLQQGEEFFVFDVRNEDEYDSWKIEGTVPLPMANVPYYEMLEVDEHDDVVDTFVDFLERDWSAKLPKDKPVLAVCAKGDTSEFVAQAMQRLGFEAYNLDGGTKAWGDFYDVRTIEESEERSVYQVVRPARGCLSHVVVSDGKGVVIDPLRHVQHYRELAESKGFEITLVLDTHGHADHISGAAELVEDLSVPYFLHPYDGIHPIDVLPAKLPYEFLEDGLEFSVGNAEILTIHIPGHTLGNVVYLLDEKYLFTGDSIFIESIARPDLGGRGDTWAPIHYESLSKLMQLDDSLMILPGHFSSMKEEKDGGLFAATLGELKKENEGLLMAQKTAEEFVEYILASLPKFPEEYVDIKRVNAGLLEVGESKASELELGKNICALSQAYDE
jgi:glyoxylase-like metal-dependent hydrolase (beta-lactamase superfamily II)